jgi:hypothetical protein
MAIRKKKDVIPNPDQSVKLTVLRDDKTRKVEVKFGGGKR